jgi:hypothetical protein
MSQERLTLAQAKELLAMLRQGARNAFAAWNAIVRLRTSDLEIDEAEFRKIHEQTRLGDIRFLIDNILKGQYDKTSVLYMIKLVEDMIEQNHLGEEELFPDGRLFPDFPDDEEKMTLAEMKAGFQLLKEQLGQIKVGEEGASGENTGDT